MNGFDDIIDEVTKNGAALPTDHVPKKKPVSKSQAVRFALHRLWQVAASGAMDFEHFYQTRMDAFMDEIEVEIANITFPPRP